MLKHGSILGFRLQGLGLRGLGSFDSCWVVVLCYTLGHEASDVLTFLAFAFPEP